MSPRAPKGCGYCRNTFPCPDHPQGWKNRKSEPLPGNWRSLVRAVKARDRMICRRCRKFAEDGQVDHILNRRRGGTNDLKNLQWLCRSCHSIKTKLEAAYGRKHR